MQFLYYLVIVDAQRTVLRVKRSQFGHVFECRAVCFHHTERLIEHPCLDKKRFGVHTRLFEQSQELCVLHIGKTHHYAISSWVVLLWASSFSPIAGCFLFLFHFIDIYSKASGAGFKPVFNLPKSNRLRRLLSPPAGQAVPGYRNGFG